MRYVGILLVAVVALVAALSLRGEQDPPREQVARPDATRSCTVVRPPTRLPREVYETSGLAMDGSGVLWTHNDAGGQADLYGFDTTGRQVAHVAVGNAGATDWEDIDAGPCGEEACLFIGDIGDNNATRDHVTIYRVPEPAAAASRVAATALHAQYPEGPQDAEGLIALPDGRLFIVTKGEHGPVRLYHLPRAAAPGGMHRLELVRELAPSAGRRGDRVTAATASRDGAWIAIRTYESLHFYAAAAVIDSARARPVATFDLRPVREPQGEGLALDAAGGVWLTSEAESGGEPFLTGLSCPYRE